MQRIGKSTLRYGIGDRMTKFIEYSNWHVIGPTSIQVPSTLSRTSIPVMMQLIGKEHDTTTNDSAKGDWKKNVLQSLPYSVFPIIVASICDLPWLSLNFVPDCLVGICPCAYESDCFVMLTLYWESLLIPTCFGESARQGRERFRRTFCWISLESATECLVLQCMSLHTTNDWMACRWESCCVLIEYTFEKAYLEDWQLVKDKTMTPSKTSCSQFPSLLIRQSSENSDCTLLENLTPTWKISGTQGTSAFWEKPEATLPHPKRVCNFIHPKTVQSLFRTFETAVPRRGNIISLRGRRLIHTRWFYCGWKKISNLRPATCPSVHLYREMAHHHPAGGN